MKAAHGKRRSQPQSLAPLHCNAPFRNKPFKQVGYSRLGVPGCVNTFNPGPYRRFKFPACADPTNPIVGDNSLGLYDLKTGENVLMDLEIHGLPIVLQNLSRNDRFEE
jgi:hypothetical protein